MNRIASFIFSERNNIPSNLVLDKKLMKVCTSGDIVEAQLLVNKGSI